MILQWQSSRSSNQKRADDFFKLLFGSGEDEFVQFRIDLIAEFLQ